MCVCGGGGWRKLRHCRMALYSPSLEKAVSCLLQLLEVEQSVPRLGSCRSIILHSSVLCFFFGPCSFSFEDPVLLGAVSGYSRIISPS